MTNLKNDGSLRAIALSFCAALLVTLVFFGFCHGQTRPAGARTTANHNGAFDTLWAYTNGRWIIVNDTLELTKFARWDSIPAPSGCPPLHSAWTWYGGQGKLYIKYPDCSVRNLDSAGISTAVTVVTATLPLVSSGGTTPNISSHKASATDSGYVSSSDWAAFNAKVDSLANKAGAGVAIYVVGSKNFLKRLKQGANVTVTDNGDSITIAATSSGVTGSGTATDFTYWTSSSVIGATGITWAGGTMTVPSADTLTSPGTGTNSEKYGLAAVAAALRSEAWGRKAAVSNSGATNGTAVGDSSQITGGSTNSSAFGQGSVVSASSASAFGQGSSAVGNNGTAVGQGTTANTNSTIVGTATSTGVGGNGDMTGIGYNVSLSPWGTAVGSGAQATGSASFPRSTAIGKDAHATTNDATAVGGAATCNNGDFAVGDGSSATHSGGGALGSGTADRRNNEYAIGSTSKEVTSLGGLGARIQTKTSNYTATQGDFTILVDASGGAVTVTLPAASGCSSRIYHVKKIDSSGNSVTIQGNASENIDGANTLATTTQYKAYTIQSNGTQWYILSQF